MRKLKVGEKYVDADQLKEYQTYYSLANGWIGKQFGIKIRQNSEIKLHEIANLVMKKYKCIVNPIQCRNAKKFALNEVGRDGNNHMYPIAWAIVNVDNKDNWSWFLQLLGEDIDMPTRNGLTLISDQHKAVKDVMPLAEHRQFWHVIRAGGNIFEVRNGSEAFRVDKQQRTCRCRMWQLTGGDATFNMDEPSSQVRQGGDATGTNMASVGVETGTNVGSVGVATGTNVGSMGVETGTNTGSIGVEIGTNVDSVGVESSVGNETVRSVSLGDFVSVRSKDTTTATRSRGGLGFKVRRGTSEGTQAAIRGRGGQTLGLGVRWGTSGSTSTARRSRDGQTLWLRVRRGIGLRGGVSQGVRYGRLGRWFGLGDETQPNEKLTIETQQSQSGIQQELQVDQEGRHAQAHINIQRGNHKLRPKSKRIKK
nr:pentatricopeptide repeat-containing protein [Tanacetum cinerariifolium]